MVGKQYAYRCSDDNCHAKSGTYTTTIPPARDPSCLWCGAPLQVLPSIRYGVEVRVQDGFDPATGAPRMAWKRLHPTGGPPYVWATKAEASSNMRMCYPDCGPDTVRVCEVK